LLKGPIVQGFVWLNNSELGTGPNKPTEENLKIEEADFRPTTFFYPTIGYAYGLQEGNLHA